MSSFKNNIFEDKKSLHFVQGNSNDNLKIRKIATHKDKSYLIDKLQLD